MIRDTQTTNKRNEKQYGNAVEADLAKLKKNREFAIQQQKKGKDVSALLEVYDREIARLLHT